MRRTDSADSGDESHTEGNRTSDDQRGSGKKSNALEASPDALVVSRKRMASLNASAFMAATYEAEQTLDRNLSATEEESSEQDDDDEEEEEENKSRNNTDTDGKSQQSSSMASGMSKANKSSLAKSSNSKAGGKLSPKKVKLELKQPLKDEETKAVSIWNRL